MKYEAIRHEFEDCGLFDIDGQIFSGTPDKNLIEAATDIVCIQYWGASETQKKYHWNGLCFDETYSEIFFGEMD